MRSLFQFSAAALMLSIVLSCQTAPRQTAQDLEWKVGVQAYTFRQFSFFDAVDKTRDLGLHYIEAYPGQKLGGGLQGTMDYNMDSLTREKLLKYLKQQDVELTAFGVVVPDSLSGWDALFAFAKDMGIGTIVSEPKPRQMSYVSKLCDKYDIDVAIHNHPQPSAYWSPDTLLAALQGQSPHIGSCSDVGHWKRSGLDPVECLKKLRGHIKELHFKDIAPGGPEAADTVWGTGVCNVKGMLTELHRQHFKGLFSIEYEADPENNVPQITQSLDYFNQAVAQLK
jgi:sugar phosphate isomerase/epimerase